MSVSTGDQQRLALLQKYPLEGHCLGRFAFCSAASDFLQSLLPADLVLAPQNYTPTGQHPLLLMFNNTWLKTNPNLERIATESNIALNLNYFEFIVMLPYVQFKEPQYNGKDPYCYLPILYLNSILAVFSHDRIHQACLSMVNEEELASINFKAGIIKLKNYSHAEIDEEIFLIEAGNKLKSPEKCPYTYKQSLFNAS